MAYLGSWKIDDVLYFYANTTRFDTGAATDADAVPSYRVYENETGTALLTSTMVLLDSANTAGFYSNNFTLSAANGFEKGKQYSIYKQATVNSVVGAAHDTFQIEAEVDANSMSVPAGVSSVSIPLGVSSIATPVTASSVTAGVNVTSFRGTAAVTTAAGVLSAGVSSVTGAVGSVTAPVGVSTVTIPVGVSSLATPVTASSGSVNVSSATAGVNEGIADAYLNRRISSGANTGRLVKEALYVLRNKVDAELGIVYEEDDTTSSWAFTISTKPNDPIISITPS